MTARFKDLCLDATDHQMLANWWCDVLGYERRVEAEDPDEPGWVRPPEWPVPIVDPSGAGLRTARVSGITGVVFYGAVGGTGPDRSARQWLGERPRARLNARLNASSES